MTRLIDAEASKDVFDSSFFDDEDDYKKSLRIIDNAPTVCGNNPKWCESCISKGKCASARPQDDLISRDCSTCARYSDFQKEIPDECKGCKHNYFSNYKEKERGAAIRSANNG